jgi:hypothetical protein
MGCEVFATRAELGHLTALADDAYAVAGEPRRVSVDRSVYETALAYCSALGRELRLDPPSLLGTSTEWFTSSAFEAGDVEHAHRFVDYERREFAIVDALLRNWLDDIVAYVRGAGWDGAEEHLARVPDAGTWASLEDGAAQAADALHKAISAGSVDAFDWAQLELRRVHITMNDLSVACIQRLLAEIARREGDPAVEDVILISYERLWKPRYALWFELTAHERLALSAEGMRPHYGGPGRRGDFEIVETPSSYVMQFDPCGTGGVLRRREGDAVLADDGSGGNRTPQPWSWGRIGVPWYCAHCPMLLEHFPERDFGRALRPVLWDPDPWATTGWVVPKEFPRPELPPGTTTGGAS